MKAIHIKTMTLKQRILALLLSILLLLGCVVGATLAWLTAKTNPVINTFSGSNLTISLAETQQDTYQMIPGVEIAKNPYVTVEAGSEPCYVFVKAEKTGDFDMYAIYDWADGWVSCGDGSYYYRKVGELSSGGTITENEKFNILKGSTENPDGIVTVNTDLTNADLNDITADSGVTLTFKACAVQQANLTYEQAFEIAKGELPDSNS